MSAPLRHFNTAGPCNPEWHYMVPAADRLPEARGLIDQRAYFVIHAPRQTGKTTTLRALSQALTAEGRYAALHFSCERAEPTRDDYAAAQEAVLGAIRGSAELHLPEQLRPPPWPAADRASLLSAALSAWARACPRPLALFFDEIDALRGESLRSVLRQLRDGFPERPAAFPSSVVLCGLRDVRDYKAASGGDAERLGTSSPFNVKVKSLRIGDFTEAEVRTLYEQHTAAVGQRFSDEAHARAFELTQGQPWLVNALAREVVDEMRVPVATAIEAAHMDEAKERLILDRATHLDSLVSKLMEPRVRRIVGPILEGERRDTDGAATFDDDLLYVRDLGLVAPAAPLRIANPIYREIILRVLSSEAEEMVTAERRSFVRPDGQLDIRRLLEEFATFWTQHGAALGAPYPEIAPQLVLMAFLQRIVNGGGYVEREVGIGRGRIDVLVRWPYPGPDGKRLWQRLALELKAWREKKRDPLDEGLAQLDGYLDRLGLDEGVLAIFDRRPDAPPPEERTRLEEARTPRGRRVTVLRG